MGPRYRDAYPVVDPSFRSDSSDSMTVFLTSPKVAILQGFSVFPSNGVMHSVRFGTGEIGSTDLPARTQWVILAEPL
jgi:hypothetical protein